jgi:hypothetical protein
MLNASNNTDSFSNHSFSIPSARQSTPTSNNPSLAFPNLNKPEISIVEIAGDATIGTLYSIGQVHCLYNEKTDEEYIRIGRYQFEILKYLESKQFKDLFVEGVVDTWTLQNIEDQKKCGQFQFNKLVKPKHLKELLESPDRIIQNVIKLFSERRQNPTDDQLLCLGNLGAHFVYACTNQDVTIHQAIPADKDNRLVKIQKKILANPDRNGEEDHNFLRLRGRFREDYAMREISDFLEENPSKTACLIFGIGHNMDEACGRTFEVRPSMTVVSFPRAYDQWRNAPTYVRSDE